MKPSDFTLAIARSLIARQVELMHARDLPALRLCFTERLRSLLQLERLEKGLRQLGQLALEDLVASIELGGLGIKVKMSSGRTLTMFVLVGDEWKADTLWFG